ncbi:hypothetical protein P153DRAFT_363972 [Dothidotthia symphoricarpi CBS 119687]|uniref:Uncharacterized protein n=1 Tax=Dothidotthia symphoricarpi CBS 119687 TaxID=1392245 RepID=A0A6A6ANR3_9PLEO|nr:uncharacterized protein P153DRAFT_363972 [Dothidotthia symphoricarpi CBS 119687]KAF2132685.1 hypothetical protein P153DRAFT_363972 [Dothidotthia symphoricarpi CBS 119687]
MSEPISSTGRGGAGNIGHDPRVYIDGGITRQGPTVPETEGTLSTGRGGAGNIGSPKLMPADHDRGRRISSDNIPGAATMEAQDEFHTGRGGAGNIYKEKYGGHSQSPDRKGLGDKIKQALHLEKKEKHEPSPLANTTTTK